MYVPGQNMKAAGSCFVVLLSLALYSPVLSQCSGSTLSLTADSYSAKYITSPNYANAYPNYSNCKWTITSTTNVVLGIEAMAVERGYDYVKIYDGVSASSTRLYTSATTQPLVLVASSGQSLYITFTSDYSLQLSGFRMSYIAVDTSVLPACSLSASSSKNQYAYLTSTAVNGCTRTITAGASNRVKITVPILKDSAFVTMSDGASYSTTISTGGSSTYVGSTTTMTVYATSDAVIVYEEVSSGSSGVVVTSSTPVYSSICDVTYVIASSSVQQLVSPGYPNQYTTNKLCNVKITAANGSASVSVTVDDWEMGNDDTLSIYDGPDSSGYSYLGYTWSAGSIINSTGTSLYLVFYSSPTSTDRGFRLNFTTMAATVPTCGSSHTLLTPTSSPQVIQSTNYPSTYPNNLDEYWLIQKANETDSLVLDLHVFRVEEATNCRYDKLTIYDGACTTDSTLVVICGYSASSYVDSSGRYILIRFETDGSITDTGFEIKYYVGQLIEDEEEDDDSLALGYKIAIGVVCGVLFLSALVATIVYCREKSSRRKFLKQHPKPAPVAVKTTSQLLTELDAKYRNKIIDLKNKTKAKRKPQSKKYVQDESPPKPPPNAPQATPANLFLATNPKPPVPSPPGPPQAPPQSHVIANPVPSPPVPPQAPPQSHVMTNDSVYPPAGPDSGPMDNPAMPPGYPGLNEGMPSPRTGVPSPFAYLTPAQAREMGVYGQ